MDWVGVIYIIVTGIVAVTMGFWNGIGFAAGSLRGGLRTSIRLGNGVFGYLIAAAFPAVAVPDRLVATHGPDCRRNIFSGLVDGSRRCRRVSRWRGERRCGERGGASRLGLRKASRLIDNQRREHGGSMRNWCVMAHGNSWMIRDLDETRQMVKTICGQLFKNILTCSCISGCEPEDQGVGGSMPSLVTRSSP